MYENKEIRQMLYEGLQVAHNIALDGHNSYEVRMSAVDSILSLWENINDNMEDGLGPWIPNAEELGLND